MRKYEHDLETGTSLAEPPESLYEVVDEQFVEKPMSVQSQLMAMLLGGFLEPFARINGLGWVTSETLFDFLKQKNRRRPDLAFVSYESWPRRRKIPESEAWSVIPEIAIEIVSPTNRVEDLAKKIDEYFLNGVGQVWVVYPQAQRVDVYQSPSRVELLYRKDTLTCERFLPGFALPLAQIFLEHDEVETPAK